MPGKTWKDLKRDHTDVSARPSLLPSNNSLNDGGSGESDVLEQAKQASPQLRKLLRKRKVLENNLRNLSSGENEALDPRDVARFQVLSFAERQAQQREWEEKKARERPSHTHHNKITSNSLSTSTKQWLTKQDVHRQRLRDASRNRFSSLYDLGGKGRQVSRSLSNSSGQLHKLLKELDQQGLSQESEEIKRFGGGRLGQMQSKVDRYTKVAETPKRKVDKIDSFWEKRQQQVSDAMDEAGPYFEQSKRRLSTRTGGSGGLFERMERNRKKALQRRREKRREEEKDEARRERARVNKHKSS